MPVGLALPHGHWTRAVPTCVALGLAWCREPAEDYEVQGQPSQPGPPGFHAAGVRGAGRATASGLKEASPRSALLAVPAEDHPFSNGRRPLRGSAYPRAARAGEASEVRGVTQDSSGSCQVRNSRLHIHCALLPLSSFSSTPCASLPPALGEVLDLHRADKNKCLQDARAVPRSRPALGLAPAFQASFRAVRSVLLFVQEGPATPFAANKKLPTKPSAWIS